MAKCLFGHSWAVAGLLLPITVLIFDAQYAQAEGPEAGAVELVELRDRAARHYRNPDGSMVAVISAIPTDFRNAEGWLPIDPAVTEA